MATLTDAVSAQDSTPQTPPASPSTPTTSPSTPTLQKETVTGGKLSDTDERRTSTASKMVFGREELDRFGDSNLGDVLKRLPGVTISGTPGRGGDIRMRGLGRGYTLILINGEPAPRGFSIDSLSPDQVDRIEIYRAPVAENSARAIAGTINIILREEVVKRENEVKLSLGHERGSFAPNVSIQRNDKIDRFSYNVSATTGFRHNARSDFVRETTAVDTQTGATVLHQTQTTQGASSFDFANANAQLNWRLDGGDNFVLTPFVTTSHSKSHSDLRLDQDIGTRPAPYAASHSDSDNKSLHSRMFGNWRLRFKDGGRLELRFNIGYADTDSRTDTAQSGSSGALIHRIASDAAIRDTSVSQSGKFSKQITAGHQFGAGWEAESSQRRETAHNVLDGIDSLAQYGDIAAKTGRVALYVQDEWDVTPLWASYGGLRWETIRTSSTTSITDVRNRSAVLSPLFHTVWKFDPESKDQLRLAVSRTYRTPTLGNLTAIPALNSTYPASEPNTPTNADTIGNPDLKPELAWGADVTIEHYFEAGGLVSANVFRRSIDDLIRNVTTLETVGYSPFQRWVSRPRNVGHAISQGVELEAKFRLDEVFKDWPKLNLRVNYSRFWSSVDGIPGPNNRLAQQPPWTANVGGDYRMTALPLSFGANLNFTPSYVVTEAIGQEYRQGRKRSADAYALWKVNPAIQLRLSAANLFADRYLTGNREVFGTTDQVARNDTRTYRFYSARLEVKF